MKRILYFIFVIIVLTGCSQLSARKFDFQKKDYEIEVGKTEKLLPIVDFIDYDFEIIYTPDNSEIAQVIDGILYGLKEGSTKIKVELTNSKEKSITLNVKVVRSTTSNHTDSIRILGNSVVVLNVGDSLTLEVETNSTAPVRWTSSFKDVASISNEGKVKALKKGTTKITASVNGVSDFVIINVLESEASDEENNQTEEVLKITIFSEKAIYLHIGETVDLSIVSNIAYTEDVIWTSNYTNVATITQTGKLTAVAVVTSRIEAEVEGESDFIIVTVLEVGIEADVSEVEATILFSNEEIIASTKRVDINKNQLTIYLPGTYTLEGTSNDANILINVSKEEKVTLILNNLNLTSKNGSVIKATSSDKLTISTASDSVNYITDSATSETEIKACIHSCDDITFEGQGTLYINANYNNAVDSNDDLKIKSGSLIINSKKHALKANNSIICKNVYLEITAGMDGMHCEHDTDTSLGYITIENGSYNIIAYGDGIDCSSVLTILNGDFIIRSGVSNSNLTLNSGKGIKGLNNLEIYGGVIDIESKDDAIHSNNQITINNGTLKLSSNDDGIHADNNLNINGGTINIIKSYEGLEALNVTINNGDISIVATDDGINVAGGVDGSSNFRPGPGSSGNALLTINGGNIYVNASGDGLDANGSINMTGGTVIVNGPTKDGDGPLDYDRTFNITGGFLIASGSAGMAQNVSTSSTQCAIKVNLTSASSSIIRLQDASGNDIATYKPSKTYRSFLISSNLLQIGSTYSIYTGGSVSGYNTYTNGLYNQGDYSGGTLLETITLSSTVTNIGSSGGGMMPPPRPR